MIQAQATTEELLQKKAPKEFVEDVPKKSLKVFYGTQTGTAKKFAAELAEEARTRNVSAEITDLKDYDPEDRLNEEVGSYIL